MTNNYKPFYLLLFILALLVSFVGITTDFFTDDPGLYASISKNMLYKHDMLQLFTYNRDWLDKPHFPFWAAMASFKLFGVSVWAYRLPALLFFLLSALYTYLFARRFYTKEIALTAVLILITAQHIILSNLDVRAEPYLMGLLIGSIYHIARYNDKPVVKHLLLAALLTACAIMTKGVFVIVAIYGSLLGQLIYQKKFLHIFYGKWLLLYLLTFVFTLPEFYALYIQFDLHPEKTVFDRHNVSGIRWFLWDSQFGRFVNNGPIKQKASGDPSFFIHTMLWAFLPWCLLFYYAVYKSLKNIWQKVNLPEYYTLSGGLLLLVLFSLSRFQLPFYTNILFPLFAIITAPYCFKQLSRAGEYYRKIVLLIFAVLLPVVIIVIHIYLKPVSNLLFVIDCILFGLVAALIIIKVRAPAYRVFMLTCCAVLFANFYLNTVLFPTIASYSGQVSAGKYINRPEFNDAHIYSLRMANNMFQFYSNKPVDFISPEDFNAFKPTGRAIFFVSQPMLDQLTNTHADFKIIKTFTDYPQENILPAFVNHATRHKVLAKVYLISK
ncbi:ArnT family glycosyltransferase [Mucilaginibacter aquariorum]|uniref:Glycosyltransferase family 39 protein n=1 Tax=Mucilaginibacter aquariorum TaxID=2967225 RepID=A0ABT1T6J9_9SPHI|nr:glycosyltransferase family 39 protein [Mucilaginibacter aquariorum]MCQ6960258.1 glycosyltransferase family 39 protein [Mucilaginibacter aquariorum]